MFVGYQCILRNKCEKNVLDEYKPFLNVSLHHFLGDGSILSLKPKN